MIHESNNFLLTSIFSSASNSGNVDHDFVGTITFDGNQFRYKNSIKLCLERKAKIAKNNSQKRSAINYTNKQISLTNERIALILESPSNSEFLPSRPCPAWGRTGGGINEQLISLMNKYVNVCFPTRPTANSNFDIIIINAIRYQCDLGNQGNRTIINSVFEQLWNYSPTPFSDDLVERIKFVSPSLIINACTSSNTGLKLCTTSFLKNKLSNVRIVEATSHPCRWNKYTILF